MPKQSVTLARTAPEYRDDLEDSENIYGKIIKHVNDLVQALSQETQDSKLSQEQNAAKTHLEEIEKKIQKSVEQLRKNAEWKVFTLAFYGETNAGKSTLIETLRILLGERSKMEQQERFRALQQDLNLSESHLQSLEQQIEAYKGRLNEIDNELAEALRQYDAQEASLAERMIDLQQSIYAQKASAGWFQRILHWFRKLPEEYELQEVQADAARFPVQRQAAEDQARDQKAEVQRNLETSQTQLQTTVNELPRLEALQDGRIIGDGRSDFTREAQEYVFEAKGQTFQILDVPGIEGDEAKVSEQIAKAVQRAHVVFYVTSKAAPPQTGDAGRPGTLEKIRVHLRDQTEVRTLFNKRITNPNQLYKVEPINDDERGSLRDLDEKMRTQLGEHYQGTTIISALPAFLAAADCLTPRSNHANGRQKFLNAQSREQILERSNLEAFRQHLTEDLIANHKEKIRQANWNKIGMVLSDTCNAVESLRLEKFLPLTADLKHEVNNSSQQLKMALDTLKNSLKNRSEQAIERFKNSVRKSVYNEIEKNINNNDFKNILEESMEHHQLYMESTLSEKFDDEIYFFREECKGVFDRFQQHVNDLKNGYDNIYKIHQDNFELNIKIDNGISYKGIFGAIGAFFIGAALAPTSGGASVAAAWSLCGSFVIAMWKSIKGFFSSKYKMSQQKQSTDENLDSVCEEFRKSLELSLKESIDLIEDNVQRICAGLEETVQQTEQICESLNAARQKLSILSTSLKNQGTH